MKSRHIAMFSLLGSGHVYPMLGLCAELVRRGHRVTYLVPDRFVEKVRGTGAEPLPFKVPELTNAEQILRYPSADDPHCWSLLASIFYPLMIVRAAATVSQSERFYRENRPDLIVYDQTSFGARVLAGILGCPLVQVWAHFAHRDFLIREDGVCKDPEPMHGFANILDSFMSASGVESGNNLWHREEKNIYFVPKEFQFDTDKFDHRFHFVGPCLNRPSQRSWARSGGHKPILLISESASMQDGTFLHACINAFADSSYHVVFSVGGNTPPIKRDLLPGNFEINRDAYNLEILPHAAAIVCQSGMGVTLESLYFGVPVVAIPNQSFNAEVAYRIAELGLGIYLRERDVTSDSLRASVGALMTDTAMRSRLEVIQKAVRNSGGAGLAASLIEETFNG